LRVGALARSRRRDARPRSLRGLGTRRGHHVGARLLGGERRGPGAGAPRAMSSPRATAQESPAASAVNPLRAGLEGERALEPCVVVTFGATGDLARRNLLPALYALALEHRLPVGLTVIGVARRPMSDAEFRKQMGEAVAAHGRTAQPAAVEWEPFAEGLFYQDLDYNDPRAYGALAERLARLDAE